MLTIHLRVTDAATARPTPVRIRLTGPDGTAHVPFGRAAAFPTGPGEAVGGHLSIDRESWHAIDGTAEVKLPAGVPVRVRITKGPEYEPLDTTVTLGSGQMALRFAVRRWADPSAVGWFSGDTRVHVLSPHDATLDAAAEGVNVVHLLAGVREVASIHGGQTFPLAANIGAFSGQKPALDAHGVVVAVNTFNRHPVLGSVGLLHSHRPVFPLTFGGADDVDDWSVCDWCDQCHRKNGLTVWADPFTPDHGGEALVAAILGKIDAVEFTGRLTGYYRLLNAGVVLPVVGGSGKADSLTPIGSPRTYARLNAGDTLTLANWVDAVRAGRCYATNGPIVTFDIGDTVRASATSVVPFVKLELVHNGKVIESVLAVTDDDRWVAAGEWPVPAAGWVAVRCAGVSTFAHTAPVVVGEITPAPAAVAALRACLERTRDWIADHGRFQDDRRKADHLARIAEAEARLGTTVL